MNTGVDEEDSSRLGSYGYRIMSISNRKIKGKMNTSQEMRKNEMNQKCN